ncbi:MgtC/SapB family protein [Phormidium sp. CCY1219]|uniref:MgtC/SapB family protein n=1 Tax=Phormidium sp. CCY1219 TaxID=2886104 RepID=UPI002D1EA35B|nr:MgtC/SapB family protein [Phormidium sp. CCY1219]MEB3831245.1 MgtC/SapB family protein [Phormidium sp. CCY1219]
MSTPPSIAPIDALTLLFRLSLSLLVGAAIGLERQSQNKPAGLRTYMLVSFGAALFAILPIQLGLAVQSADAFTRIIQGIISGVSFIGAGTILRDQTIQGLTTAAAIWVTAALGVIISCGFWELGLISALVCWFILKVLKKIELK